MESEVHKGNIVILKRPLADFICVVSSCSEEEVKVRYIDSPPEDKGVSVKREEVIKLADAQERELPGDFLNAIERQRQVIFAQKKERAKKLDLSDLSDATYEEIFKILAEDGKEVESE
jgi:hypothetical protein